MSNPFTPSATDGAMGLLHMIFGDVVQNMMSSAGTVPGTVGDASLMLTEAFRLFNSGVLVFGTFILTWVTIFGVANSANDGEILGKTWNSFYTPLRTIGAAAALIPSSSGYATVQIMMLYVVAWSIGFASSMWTGIVNVALSNDITQSAENSLIADGNFDTAITAAIRMGTCAQALSTALTSAGIPATLTLKTLAIQKSTTGTTSYSTKYYYSDTAVAGSDTLCGTLTLNDTKPVLTATKSTGLFGLTTIDPSTDPATILRGQLSAARALFVSNELTSFVPAQVSLIIAAANSNSASTTTSSTSTSLSSAISSGVSAGLSASSALSATTLATNLATYRNQLRTTILSDIASQMSASTASLSTSLTSQGWIGAGSYWLNIAKIKDAIAASSSPDVSYVAPDENALQTMLGDGEMFSAVNGVASKYEVIAAEWTKQALASPAIVGSNTTDPAIPVLQSNFTLNDFTGGAMGIHETFLQYFNYLPTVLVSGIVNRMNISGDPLMTVKDLGDWLSVLANSVVVAKVTATAVLKATSKGADAVPIGGKFVSAAVQGVLEWFLGIFGVLAPSLYTIMYIGYFMSIWLPMIPFYIFALGVVGWLVFVVEMMIASVLWAAAHTTPARDNSFIGSQMQGYMLVMSGFFRPALMVMGLVASNAILYPAVMFINWSFIQRFQSMTQDSAVVLSSVAGYLLVYTVLMFSVFTMCFELTQTLPDRILRWLGAGVGDLGESKGGSKIDSMTSGQSRQAMMKGMQMESSKAQQAEGAKNREESSAAASARNKLEAARHDSMMAAIGGRGSQPMTETGQAPDISSRESNNNPGGEPERE